MERVLERIDLLRNEFSHYEICTLRAPYDSLGLGGLLPTENFFTILLYGLL